eukprot:8231820-Pyramimonas_sp.AAC.1
MAQIRPKRTLRCPNIVSKTAAETTKKKERVLQNGACSNKALNWNGLQTRFTPRYAAARWPRLAQAA